MIGERGRHRAYPLDRDILVSFLQLLACLCSWPGGPIFDYRAQRRLSDIYWRKQRHIGIHNVVEGLCDKSNRAKRVPILITEGNELLPVEIKSGTGWLPGIPTRVYSHMLMPAGILLTAATVIPSLLLAFITALVALTLGCDWRISSVTFFLQLGFGLNDFRVACFTVRPGR